MFKAIIGFILRPFLYLGTSVISFGFLLPIVLLTSLVTRFWSLCRSFTVTSDKTSSATRDTPIYEEPVSRNDQLWLLSDVFNLPIITAVLVFDAPISHAELISILEERLLNEPGTQRLRCLPQEQANGKFIWKSVENFNILDHAVCIPYWKELCPTSSIHSSESFSSSALQHYISSVASEPLPSGIPGWCFQLLPNYEDGCAIVFRCHHSIADGVLLSGVLLKKLMDNNGVEMDPPIRLRADIASLMNQEAGHPAEDGLKLSISSPEEAVQEQVVVPDSLPSPPDTASLSISAPLISDASVSASLQVLPSTFSLPTTPSRPAKSKPKKNSFVGIILMFLFYVKLVLLGPYHLFALTVRRDDVNALHYRHLSGKKSCAWSEPISMDRIKLVRKEFGRDCTVNDVMIAVLMSAIDRLNTKKSDSIRVAHTNRILSTIANNPKKVRPLPSWILEHQRTTTMCIPVNVRSTENASKLQLGNHISVLLVPFPLAAKSLQDRLLQVTGIMTELKKGVVPTAMLSILSFIVLTMPMAFISMVLDSYSSMCTGIITNNRSPSYPLYCRGRRLLYWVSWAPASGSIGLSITILTYDNSMRISVLSDKATLNDAAELVALYNEEFQLLEAQIIDKTVCL